MFVEVLTTQLHIYKYVWCARALILHYRVSEFWIPWHSHQGWWFSSPVWKAQQRCYYGNSVLRLQSKYMEKWFTLREMICSGNILQIFCECFEFEMWFKWFTPTGMICSGNTHGWIPSVLNLHNRENHKNLTHKNFDLCLEKYINNCNRSLPIITFFQVLFQSIQNIDQLRPPYFQTQIMLFPKKLMVLGKLSILAVNLFFI